MKVRCQICGKEIETESAFVIKKDNKVFYYCSETEYIQKQKITKQRIEIVSAYAYCLEASEKSIYSLIQKEFSYNVKSLGIERVYYFVIKNKDKIKRTILSKEKEIGKDFTNFNKIKYITAIIKKQLEKEEPPAPPASVAEPSLTVTDDIDINIYEQKNKYINKRRALSDLEDMYVED